MATWVYAPQNGFRPIVAGDAWGDRTPAVHDADLFGLGAEYADVTTVAEVTRRLSAGPELR